MPLPALRATSHRGGGWAKNNEKESMMEENMQIGTFADDNSAALSDKAGEAANADWDGFTDQDNTADPGENADRQDAAEEVREGA